MQPEIETPVPGRALVPLAVEPQQPRRPHRPVQRAASFVAQLIAGASRAPQAREHRRAEAAEVIAAYRETVERIRSLDEKSA